MRSEQTGKDNKIALDAALQAAEKAVGAKNQSNDLAIAKSESSMTKQIEQLQVMISTKDQASTEKISDLKDRLIATGVDLTGRLVATDNELKNRLAQADGEIKTRLSALDGRLATIEGRGVGVEETRKSSHDQTSLTIAAIAVLVAIVSFAVGMIMRPSSVIQPVTVTPSVGARTP